MFGPKPLVFLSYSRKDKEKVADLRRRLDSGGFRTWLDTEEIVGGEWRIEIKRGLRQSKFFLACMSQNTVERGAVLQYELDSALEIQRERLEGDIYLIPVRLEPCELPDSLNELQRVDIYEADGWKRLRRVLGTKSRRLPVAAAAAVSLVLLAVFTDAMFLHPAVREAFLNARSEGQAAVAGKKASVGVTLWKMEPSKDSDPPSVREIVHPQAVGAVPAEPAEWTPVRLSEKGGFSLGDRFQVTLETSRSGYLYVVNRSRRTDGSVGPASLIFPTARIRGGDNRIWPGMMIRLPDRDSKPPFWRFESDRTDYAGEDLIVLLTPNSLEGGSGGGDPARLDNATLDDWTRRYGQHVRSVAYNTSQTRLTVEEATARDAGAQLPRFAPLPSVLFEADRPPEGSVLITLPILMRRN